jgi:hypothetical protein
MGCRLVLGVLGMVAVSSSVWAAEADSAPSDSDLMFEALKQWRGESSSDSAAVERLLAAAKRESRMRRESIRDGVAATFWRDPFADDPQALIPVRREDRDLLDNLREASRARAEMVVARAEAAAARADTVAARAEAARAGRAAARADALAARRRAAAAQAGCADPRVRREYDAGRTVDPHARREYDAGGTVDPLGSPARLNRPPTGWTSADSRGILVVPIEASISQARRSAHLR